MTLSSREVVSLSWQPTLGTGVAPAILVPFTPGSARFEEQPYSMYDSGRRGIDAMDHQAVEGVKLTEISWDGSISLMETSGATGRTPIGFLLANILNTDTYTAVDNGGTTAFDHFLHMGNTKSYLTIGHSLLRSSSDVSYEDCRVRELTIRWNSGEGMLTYSVTLVGQPPIVEDVAEGTDPTGPPFQGWHATVTFSGAVPSPARLVSAEWTLRRELTPFYPGANQQTFADIYSGPLEAIVQEVLNFPDTTELAKFRQVSTNQAEHSHVFTVGTPNAATERTFAIGGVSFDMGEGPASYDMSNPNVRLTLTSRGLYSVATGPFSGANQNGPIEVQITGDTDVEFNT